MAMTIVKVCTHNSMKCDNCVQAHMKAKGRAGLEWRIETGGANIVEKNDATPNVGVGFVNFSGGKKCWILRELNLEKNDNLRLRIFTYLNEKFLPTVFFLTHFDIKTNRSQVAMTSLK
mmetsp:Transcript_15497/g.25490  ORF Transcript_15497/g.25490 Transcript_15497/m.25490 type:complete len:118 (-) Transcript_15497:33-386(-)